MSRRTARPTIPATCDEAKRLVRELHGLIIWDLADRARKESGPQEERQLAILVALREWARS